jgi:hypothetical protein
MITNLFSPFLWKKRIREHDEIREYIEPLIHTKRTLGEYSPDWNVDTSYDQDFEFNWWPCIEHYKKYVNDFHWELFGIYPDWRISGEPWYTAYGKNQSADRHDHIPDNFSALHILKYDKEKHKPLVFINPQYKLNRALYSDGPISKISSRAKNDYYNNWHYVDADEGDILIWPSILDHFVQKNESDDLRITIAFNYNITET